MAKLPLVQPVLQLHFVSVGDQYLQSIIGGFRREAGGPDHPLKFPGYKSYDSKIL